MDAQTLLARRRQQDQEHERATKVRLDLSTALEPLQPAKCGWLVTKAAKRTWSRALVKFAAVAGDAQLLQPAINLVNERYPITEQEAAALLGLAETKRAEQVLQYLNDLPDQQAVNDVHMAVYRSAVAISNGDLSAATYDPPPRAMAPVSSSDADYQPPDTSGTATGHVCANETQLFPKGELADGGLTKLARLVAVGRLERTSDNAIARQFLGDRATPRRVNSILTSLRKQVRAGMVNLPPARREQVARKRGANRP